MREQPHNARFFAAMLIAQDSPDRVHFPVTIVMALYGGTYEGGRWLAFPIGVEDLAGSDYAADDISCLLFFEACEERRVPIGRGETPDKARADLRARFESSSAPFPHQIDSSPGDPHERDRADD